MCRDLWWNGGDTGVALWGRADAGALVRRRGAGANGLRRRMGLLRGTPRGAPWRGTGREELGDAGLEPADAVICRGCGWRIARMRSGRLL